MKRMIWLFLALAIPSVFLLSGCANTVAPGKQDTPKLTMEKVSEVNTAAHLLERYKTITYAQLDYIGGDTIHMTYFKDENGNCCVTEDDSGYSGYRTDGFTFSREKGKSTYDLSATEEANVSNYLFMVSDSEFTSQTTDTSGNLVCETQADISQEFADQLSKTWSATTEDKMVTTAVFAADDFRMLSTDFRLRRPNGSECKIASGVMLYDQEVQHTDAVQRYLDAEQYTVDIQLPDGSKRTAQIPKGEPFTWTCDDGFALYKDSAGKTPLRETSALAEQDMTLYVLKAQH